MSRLTPALFALVFLLACSKDAAPGPAAPAAPTGPVVATVNGVPISQTELSLQLRARPPRKDASPAQAQQEALDELVNQELYAQKAEAVGLDKDPAFLSEAARVEAQVRLARRAELARIYRLKELVDKAAPTADEVRAAYDADPKRFRTTVRVNQLVLKGRPALEAVEKRLAAGESFEDVARSLMGDAPEGQRPWELPALPWVQVPLDWWPVLSALQPGQVAKPVQQRNERFVLLQLVERSEGPEVAFEQVRPLLEASLKADRVETQRAQADAELRKGAKIEISLPPPPLPPAATGEE